MKIKMAGIDHTTATLKQREVFAFTSGQAQNAMQHMVQSHGVKGCIVVSTCNRTELWISEEDDRHTDLAGHLCGLKNVCLDEYRDFLTAREGMEAIRHLFETTSGLKSQVWGEDQILAQIKTSIERAREAGTTDEVLEKLFQAAVTAAKRIKTKIRLTRFDVSVATKAIEAMKENFSSFRGLNCLVIGNGEMGRKIALLLADSGAMVTITLRQYKNAINLIPEGCGTVLYENRISRLQQADLIVSATSSPHYTIRLEEVKDILGDGKPRFFVDLAVPRDIDPSIAVCRGVRLLDMDKLGVSYPDPISNKSFSMAKKIINDTIQEFSGWEKRRELLPFITDMASTTSEKMMMYLNKDIDGLGLDQLQKEHFKQRLSNVTTKAVINLLYEMNDKMANINQ